MVALNPVAGAHEYVPPPVALSVVLFPAQIATSAPALTELPLNTVTVTMSIAVHEPFVAVNVYVVVAVGVATGLAIVVELNPVGGVHAYVVEVVAGTLQVNVVPFPGMVVGAPLLK